VRRLFDGEVPRTSDDFQKFTTGGFQRAWDAGAPYAATKAYKEDLERPGLEREWRAMHAQR
jgi:hypothetical protein